MSTSSTVIASKPSLIEYEHLRFLIMDAPKDTNLHLYLKECERCGVTDIARISEPTYDKAEVEKAGISLHVISFHRTNPTINIVNIGNAF
jgi:protein tyrosine phosphatase type IVA